MYCLTHATPDHSSDDSTVVWHIAEDEYEYIVNGEAFSEITAYLASEHTFEESAQVSETWISET